VSTEAPTFGAACALDSPPTPKKIGARPPYPQFYQHEHQMGTPKPGTIFLFR